MSTSPQDNKQLDNIRIPDVRTIDVRVYIQAYIKQEVRCLPSLVCCVRNSSHFGNDDVFCCRAEMPARIVGRKRLSIIFIVSPRGESGRKRERGGDKFPVPLSRRLLRLLFAEHGCHYLVRTIRGAERRCWQWSTWKSGLREYCAGDWWQKRVVWPLIGSIINGAKLLV